MFHREEDIDLNSPLYTPNKLLNETMQLLGCKTDARLALILECDQAVISRVRSRKDPIRAWLMVQIMDRTGWHIQEVRQMAGIPFDGPTKLVRLAHEIGLRFPNNWTA